MAVVLVTGSTSHASAVVRDGHSICAQEQDLRGALQCGLRPYFYLHSFHA